MAQDSPIRRSVLAHIGGFFVVLWMIPLYVSAWVALFATMLFGLNAGDIRQRTTLPEIWGQIFTWQYYLDFLMSFYPLGILLWLVAGVIAAFLRSRCEGHTLRLGVIMLSWLTGFVILTIAGKGFGDIASVSLRAVIALLLIPIFGLALKVSEKLPQWIYFLQESTVESILNQFVQILQRRR